MNFPLKHSVVMLTAALLTACGGGGAGGVGGGIGGGGSTLAGGGISGTGSGTVTGFGSIFLNGRGEFETDNAQILIDGDSAAEADLNLGMVVDVEVSGADDQFSTGNADRLVVIHEIKGPITAVSPLQVFGQTVVVTGDTVLQDDSATPATLTNTLSLSSLQLNNEVEISGHRDNLGVIQATRIEYQRSGLSQWKLSGRISNLAGNTFTIGSQAVNIGSISPSNCDNGLQNGVRVEIKATPELFNPGDTLDTVTAIDCQPETLQFSGSLTGSIAGEVEGFVTNLAASSFTVGDQNVLWDASTLFEGGTPVDDLVPGVKVNAQGSFDLSTKSLSADLIRFRQTRFRLQGPADLSAFNSVELLGLSAQINAQTNDDDGLSGSNRSGVQVLVKGFIDGTGQLFADELKDQGAANNNDVRVRGRITDLDRSNRTFKLFGITIDGDSATQFEIENVEITDPDAFFVALSNGDEVDVEDGTFDATNNRITDADLEIEIDD